MIDPHGSDKSAQQADEFSARNPGLPLDLEWVMRTRVNKSAVERRASTIPTRRTVKKEWQAAWLLRAITLIDLTTLAGDDTPGNVKRLCAKARNPVRQDLLEALNTSESRSVQFAFITHWLPQPSKHSKARAFRWPPSAPPFQPVLPQ
jgi:hypothetical protein